MAKTKLFIRPNDINSSQTTVIYIRYSHKDLTIDFSTSELIQPQYWDRNKQQIRKSHPNSNALNTYLHSRKLTIEKIRLDLQTRNIEPSTDNIRDEYYKSIAPVESKSKPKYMLEYWGAFISYKKDIDGVADKTLQQYRTTLKTLNEFEKFTRTRLTFDQTDSGFYEQFKFYCFETKKYNPNTTGNKIKMIKTFLAYALDKNFTTNHNFSKFKKTTSESTFIALTQEQLDQLYYLDLSDNKKLAQSRDLFVIGCSCGFRFSDFCEIKLANVKNDYLIKHINKTKEQIKIPLNQYSRSIIEKYPTGLPTADNATINRHLKTIGSRAGFNEIHEITTYPGGKVKKEYKPLHQLLTTHCARRTFASQSLHRGMLLTDTMKITGHKDTKTFLKYIRHSENQLKTAMSKAWDTLKK